MTSMEFAMLQPMVSLSSRLHTTPLLMLFGLLMAGNVAAYERNSFFLYSGPATGTALLEIIKFQVPVFDPYWALTVGYSRQLVSFGEDVDPDISIELESSVSKHFEASHMWSLTGAVVARIHRPPWHTLVDSSFAFGNGLSYATDIPYSEVLHAALPSRLLYHLSIEFDFALAKDSLWRILFRVHHRSGVFGLFGGAVGGSDYICLGLRRRF